MDFYIKKYIYMYNRFIPGLCLAVSSTTLSFQLFVVYPNQQKLHKEFFAIRELLQKEYLGK
jgi:hypothetical protein